MPKLTWKQIKEDNGVSASNGVPANNVQGGAIAGIDNNPPGQLPNKKKRKALRAIISTKKM